MMDQLTKNDFQNLNLLIYTTESILEEYQTLIQLELDGKKGTETYFKSIENLEMMRNSESKIYEEMKPKAEIFLAHLFENTSVDLTVDPVQVAIRNHTDIVEERIVRTLDSLLSIDELEKQSIQMLYEGCACEELYKVAMSLWEESSKTYLIESDMSKYIEQDNIFSFLALLEQDIGMKEPTIETKFCLSFIRRNVEAMMLETKFDIPSQTYLQTICIAEMKRYDTSIVKQLQKQYAFDTIQNHIYYLLSNFSNSFLSSPLKRTDAILETYALRVGLLFLNDEEIMTSYKEFLTIAKADTYKLEYPDNSEVEMMITEAYQQVKKDKTIPIEVSFKKRK